MYFPRFFYTKSIKRAPDPLVAILDYKACTWATFYDDTKKQPKIEEIVLNVAKYCIFHSFFTQKV